MSLKFVLSIIGYIAISVVLAIGLYIYFNYHNATINFERIGDTTVNVELYSTLHDETNHLNQPNKKIRDIQSGEKMFLKDDIYAVKTKGAEYKENLKFFSVKGSELVYTYELSFSDSKLNDLLETERAPAQQAILDTYPKLAELYEVESDKLLMQGNWYITTFVYTGPDRLSRDRLRVVAQKQSDGWKSVTKPQIAIGSPEYPGIPLVVLDEVNSEKANP